MYKLCSHCKKEIYIRPCRYKEHNYCSAKCQMTYQYSHGRKPNTKAANHSIRTNGNPKLRGRPLPWFGTEREAEIRARGGMTKRGRPVPKLQGENHWNWNGGVSKTLWNSLPYKVWRRSVFERDGYKCVECGDRRGGNLEADHIKPRYHFPELTFDISNGRTLCHNCHVKTPTYGAKVKNLVYIRE